MNNIFFFWLMRLINIVMNIVVWDNIDCNCFNVIVIL